MGSTQEPRADSAEQTPPSIPTSRQENPNEYQEFVPLFRRLADASRTAEERASIRERLITGHLPIARHIARRFRNRGQREEDLIQVATVGLINAVDRFDAERGSDFLSFAVPTITGEVRRYFRDATWSVHVPRRLKELHSKISTTVTALSQDLGRSPRPKEIATELGISVEEVYEGLQAGYAYRSDSLDGADDDESSGASSSRYGELDERLTMVEDRETLASVLTVLPEREAAIVAMRFFENLTQTQIAQRVGLSQMHVSRLLSASVATLRKTMSNTPTAER